MKNPIEVIPFLLTIAILFLSECESTFPAKRQVSLWNGATGFCLTQKQHVDWNIDGPTVEDCNPYQFQVVDAPNHVWQYNLIPAESYYNNAFMIYPYGVDENNPNWCLQPNSLSTATSGLYLRGCSDIGINRWIMRNDYIMLATEPYILTFSVYDDNGVKRMEAVLKHVMQFTNENLKGDHMIPDLSFTWFFTTTAVWLRPKLGSD